MRNNSDSNKGLYKSAITGAYFGILNIFLVFIPLIYSIFKNTFGFIFYIAVGLLLLALLGIVIIKYRYINNYDFTKVRYLYYLGFLMLTFYIGLLVKQISVFGFKLSNIYILLLQLVFMLMCVCDIIISAHNGMIRLRTMYLRTIGMQYLKNSLVILLGVISGILILIPYYII